MSMSYRQEALMYRKQIYSVDLAAKAEDKKRPFGQRAILKQSLQAQDDYMLKLLESESAFVDSGRKVEDMQASLIVFIFALIIR